MGERIVGSDVIGVRQRRGRTRTEWMYGVKRALNEREMSVEHGRMIVCDRREWKAAVNA